MAQGGEDPEGREEAGQVIWIHRGWTCRRPIRRTVQIPIATKGRPDGGKTRALAPWSSLSERCDARHDQPWIDAAQIFPTQMPALQRARTEVLGHHIDERGQPPDDVLAARMMQVEGHGLLVAVLDGPPVPDLSFGRPHASHIIATAGKLDLNDFSAELRH